MFTKIDLIMGQVAPETSGNSFQVQGRIIIANSFKETYKRKALISAGEMVSLITHEKMLPND